MKKSEIITAINTSRNPFFKQVNSHRINRIAMRARIIFRRNPFFKQVNSHLAINQKKSTEIYGS